MNPQLVKRLKESPDFVELVAFLQSELDKLDSTTGLGLIDDDRMLAITTRGRIEASRILEQILAPFLENTDVPPSVSAKEYVA